MLAMLGLSWPLWVEPSAFPRVPFVPVFPELPGRVSWALFAIVLGSIAAATAGIAPRRCLALGLALLGFLVLGDQHRFQAWVYQFAMIGLLLAALPDGAAVALARWWYIATYAHSGLSKLDASFCHELGGSMLDAACGLFGVDTQQWPAAARTLAILAMPGWELLVALLLSIPVTRRAGRVGAALVHGGVILILGPWGMRHSTIVLVWNAVTAVQVWLAFGPGPGFASDRAALRPEHGTLTGWLVRAVVCAGILLPFGERSGHCDAWPAHALYASHVERTDVFIHEDDVEAYGPELRPHVRSGGPGPWRRLDLTAWSRQVRGVPVYPSARGCNGLAEALAARYGDRGLVRVVQWGRADRWTGRRTQVVLLGLESIRGQGARYLLGAHPTAHWGREDRR
jgi:hypothetical protein